MWVTKNVSEWRRLPASNDSSQRLLHPSDPSNVRVVFLVPTPEPLALIILGKELQCRGDLGWGSRLHYSRIFSRQKFGDATPSSGNDVHPVSHGLQQNQREAFSRIISWKAKTVAFHE